MATYLNITDGFTQAGGADGTRENPYDWSWYLATGISIEDTYHLKGLRTLGSTFDSDFGG